MHNVKENASDVIGALKDKVTGIQLSAKLNKLTPKEIRKPKNWTLKKSKGSGFKPMSFDNIQWREPGVRDNSAMRNEGESASGYEADSDSSQGSSPQMEGSSNVPVADLIDLDTPINDPMINDNPLTNSVFLNLQSSPCTSASRARPQRPAPTSIPVGQSTFYTANTDPFFDPFKTPTSPSGPNVAPAKPKSNWETFD